MPLRNRVDPFSNIHAVSSRGLFTGNRGIIHDPETQTLKKTSWATEGWVICTLSPLPGRKKRTRLMTKGRWTELFFLDEFTGLAAGHRPCHACQKDRAIAFRDSAGFDRISKLNAPIHADMKPRLRMRNRATPPKCKPRDLPNGAMFAARGETFLKWENHAIRWSFDGYTDAIPLPEEGFQLTPNLTCKALDNGYKPVAHPSLSAFVAP